MQATFHVKELTLCWRLGGWLARVFRVFPTRFDFVTQRSIEIRSLWPNNFFKNGFIASPSNFSFLYRACMYAKSVQNNILGSNHSSIQSTRGVKIHNTIPIVILNTEDL